MKDEIYETIISPTNIAKAYFEIGEKFILGNKVGYSGLDGLRISDLDNNLEISLDDIRDELLSLSPLMPLSCHQVPKKDGKFRDIYISSTKDRIKTQAIVRVLEPILEKVYSPFLFSYRSSHPTHLAARSVVRRYHRYYDLDYILLIDVEKYFDSIDKQIILKKLVKLGIQEPTLQLIQLFFDQTVLKDNKIYLPLTGMMQGVSLAVLLANFYLNEVDWVIGKKVALYRRVSDDLLIMDNSKSKVKEAFDYLQSELSKLGLRLHPIKSRMIKNTEPFEYLGYSFQKNKVAIASKSKEKIINKLTAELHYYPFDIDKKIDILKKKLFSGPDSIVVYLQNTIRQYRFVDDYEQIKEISENIYHILTKYFFQTYSPRNRNKTKKICQRLAVPSFYNLYKKYHHD